MKKYIQPETTTTVVEGCHILANSLNINSNSIDGSQALQKEEKDDWDIWE